MRHLDATSSTQLVRWLPCAAPLDTFAQLATLLTLVDLVVVGDFLVRQRWFTPDDLIAFVRGRAGAGASRARQAAAYVRRDVDSPMETRLRLLLVLAGISEPRVNHVIREVDGTPVRRYDLSWPEHRVIVEYDGRHHVDRVGQWESDLGRRGAIDDEGWRIIVVTSAGIYREPGRTVERVLTMLRSRGAPGLPVRPAVTGCRTFPAATGEWARRRPVHRCGPRIEWFEGQKGARAAFRPRGGPAGSTARLAR